MLHADLQRLKELSGKSQDEIATVSGIPKSTVAKILAGVTKSPSVEAVKSIVYAMGFTLADLDDSQSSKASAVIDAETEKFTKKYRALDEHGKKLVDAVLSIEYERVAGAQHRLRVVAAENGQRAFFEERDELPPLLPEDPPDV